MKKINVLGKKLYVLTKDEVYKSYADPVYFIYEHQKQTLEQVLNKLNSILVTCTTKELHITCEEKAVLLYKLGEAQVAMECSRSIEDV
jgi:hypothetical protein